ncbi:MAG: ATP-binding protein [Coxiellaceae bacterium]|nr:ATP-binding protein [Coxiellaceae bacterium]
MERYLKSYIYTDLPEKIVILMGPRQCGKTTLAKALYDSYDYFNFDALADREALLNQQWDRNKKLIIFDELHKMNNWKQWLKGLYDTQGIPPEYIVTGSAKMSAFKKTGDSLAGRHFQFRLHPFDLKELHQFTNDSPEKLFEQLWACSGFPEPFIKGTQQYYKRWRTTHLDLILKEDLPDLATVQDINSIENLILLLKNRVGGSVSYSNLARDLQKDINTVKRWLILLENLYIIYRVTPYSKNIARSLLKEPKFYFYDHNYAENDDGAKLENIAANALKKECHLLHDTQGINAQLYYLRTKDGKEIDFLVTIDNAPSHMIEIKTSDNKPHQAFKHFEKFLPHTSQLQLVQNLKRESSTPSALEIRRLIPWLSQLDLSAK